MQNNNCARLLAFVTGLVNQRLLLQCEYLSAENRIFRSQVPCLLPIPAGGVKSTPCGDVLTAGLGRATMVIIP